MMDPNQRQLDLLSQLSQRLAMSLEPQQVAESALRLLIDELGPLRGAFDQSAASKPPSTVRIWPFTKSEAGDARNTAAPINSSGRPQRYDGVRAFTQASKVGLSISAWFISVIM